MGILIRNGGMLTTVQDTGRFGYQRFGVPVAGAVDVRSAGYANMLVGNRRDDAVLEVTMIGPQIEFTEDTCIAITGADISPLLGDAPLTMYCAVPVRRGDILRFGALRSGCRAYIAFAGGLDILPALGSRATYIKAKLGGLAGRKLEKGDTIAFRAPTRDPAHLRRRQMAPEDFSQKEKTLRVILGPQDDCFTSNGIETFLGSPYTVTDKFDRMGCRLDGERIEHVSGGDIISDGLAFGAIQVPNSGTPIIMLADRQTTGGYTKIATVISVDIPLIAQSKAGDIIRFAEVGIDQAQELYLAQMAVYDEVEKQLNAVDSKSGRHWFHRINAEGYIYEVTVEQV